MARFCTHCGAAIADDKKFCIQCGTAVDAAAQAPPPPPTFPRGHQVSYQQPIPDAGDVPPPAGSRYEPMTTGGCIGAMLLMCIPVIGQILAVVWALGGCKNVNKRNLARATLIMMVIGLVISMILGFAVKTLLGKVVEAVEQETGISITGEPGEGEKGEGLLSGLLDLVAGSGTAAGTNEDLEALKELESLLGGLGQDSGELSDAIDAIGGINAEAEAQNDGWPASLRKYPGGTAAATASYRTEISGTTAEEMMEWIEALKGDGFRYQDFYDFGMTEEDMLSVNGWWATDGTIYLSLSYSEGTVTVDHMNQLPDMSALLG